jgi:hypothetical protein
MWFMFLANPVITTSVTCTTRKARKLSIVRKWIDRADCLPPKILAYQGKRFTTAGDMAMPVAMANGPNTNTTVNYAIC